MRWNLKEAVGKALALWKMYKRGTSKDPVKQEKIDQVLKSVPNGKRNGLGTMRERFSILWGFMPL